MPESGQSTEGVESPVELRVVVGGLVATAAVLVAVWVPTTGARVLVVTTVLAGYGWVVADVRAALATAGMAYLFLNGFLINRFGDLSWDGVTSVAQLGLLAGTALPALAGARVETARRDRALSAELSDPPREDGPSDDRDDVVSGPNPGTITKETCG